MTTQLPFAGIMDLDSSNETIQKGFHKNARNIVFKANRAENIKGTRQVAFSLPTGTNECIGSFYHQSKQKIIWCNYNSTAKHGIYQMVNGVITPIAVCTTVDFLNFTKNPIHSINIIATDNGDLLKFIDSLKRPRQINIDRAIAGGYGTIESSFLDVAKEPPFAAPAVAYADDGTATVNNLTKSLFQFAYSYVFDDKEESVISYVSENPIPPDFLNQNNPVTKNAKITVTLQTGKANVKKIKLYVRRNIESVYGDWYLVDTFDKSLLSIGNNTTYVYDYKNNTTGAAVDVKFGIHLYDFVPREANSQELLNGNIVVYGGVKEGYNIDFTTNVALSVDTTASIFNATTVGQVYAYWSRYNFGVVYFDDKGRTNGVITNPSFNITTPGYTETTGVPNIPRVNLTITHRPPVWASSFQIVRTKNLTKSKFINWISDSTYKDSKYAYIGIQSLFNRNEENKNSILSYDFAPGDRIRFISVAGSSTIIGNDYAIEEFVNSPDISYVARSGYFIKIKLPTTSGSFDFGVQGFGSYLIEIYTPAAVGSLNTFYEFGEVYQVGNPGLSNRYHKGGTQDQTSNLSQPATFSFTKGDVYLKPRDITTGGGGEYKVASADAWTSQMVIGAEQQSNNITNETYELGTPSFQTITSAYGPLTDWLIKTNGDAYTFTLKGAIKVNSPVNITYRVYLDFIDSGGTAYQQIDVIPNYSLSIGDNTIPFNVTFSVPINNRVFLDTDNSSSQALHYFETDFTIRTNTTYAKKVTDPNFSDTFLSAVNSNGRPFVVDESLTETYKDILRFSEAYQPGTNINQTNRFYDLNYVECDRSKGNVQRLKVRDDILRVFQYSGVTPYGIYKQMLTNAEGSDNLIQSEKVLSRIKPYNGDYGIGNQPCSLASSAGADYFTDPVHGQIRLAGDGMTPISKLYKAQYYLPPIVNRYLNSYTTETGSPSKVIGVYDFYNEEFISIFQKCKTGSTVNYAGDTLGFSEKKNGYTTFYDYNTFEWMMCADNTLVSWEAGAVYIHDSNTYNSFHGTSFPSIIEAVVNENANVKKEFLTLGYHSKIVWDCPTITTETGCESNLIASDFEKDEANIFKAAFLRDINSGGLIEGESLIGVWLQIKLSNNNNTQQFITGLYCNNNVLQKNF